MRRSTFSISVLAALIGVILLSCGLFPTPSPTADSIPTEEVPPAASPVPATVAPTEVPPEPTERTNELDTPPSQPAAPPHFNDGSEIRIDYIKMVNETDGWGISGPLILATHDGGNSWREVTPPEPLPDGIHAIAYAEFMDELSAWVVFGFDRSGTEDRQYANYQITPDASVWSTFDGGETWTPSPPLMHEAIGDSTWVEFASVDSTTGWMMIRGVYVGAGTHYVAQLFQTVDGVTWDTLDGDVGLDYTGMVFADGDIGWLTWQTTGAYASAPPEVAVTSDGGINWETRDLPPPDDDQDLFEEYEYCEPYQPVLLSPESIRLLVECFDYYDPPHEFVSYYYASEDGGEDWHTFALPEKVIASHYSLIVFDDQNSLLLGRDMYESHDGGETWELFKTVNWDGQFSFIDQESGWAIARNKDQIALVQTEDGGRTWSQLEPVVTR